jgi:hypothetical protein
VTATSTQDGTKSGTATVTIAAAGSTVTGVTVSPGSATGSAQFTATVVGTNSPSQGVTWAATAGTITGLGYFSAPTATGSAQTITITATSTQDGSKVGTATVTVPAASGLRTLSIPLNNGAGQPIANLSGLSWAFFDQTTPGSLGQPTGKGTNATTNASGVLNLALPGSALAAGGIGYLIVSDTNGTTAYAAKAFSGVVQVS